VKVGLCVRGCARGCKGVCVYVWLHMSRLCGYKRVCQCVCVFFAQILSQILLAPFFRIVKLCVNVCALVHVCAFVVACEWIIWVQECMCAYFLHKFNQRLSS
jgi:hypothetical protein